MSKIKNKKGKINEKIATDKKTEIPKFANKICTKKIKKRKKIEELPSFLQNLQPKSEEISSRPKNKNYLGPLFFGGCSQNHPPFHSPPFDNVHVVSHPVVSTEDLLKNFFLPGTVKPEPQLLKPFRPRMIKSPVFKDPYPHRCPGIRKVFVPEVAPFLINFGETSSTVEGETSREIPFCQIETSSRISKEELKILTLSDLREMKRMFMNEQERAAHSHFPKEFVLVRIIGPKIPESITFKKLPTKRKRLSELNTPPLSQIQIIDDFEKEDNVTDDKNKVEEFEFFGTLEENVDTETNYSNKDIKSVEEDTSEYAALEKIGLWEEFEDDNEEESKEQDNQESDSDITELNEGLESERLK